jgi:hypothetical protein
MFEKGGDVFKGASSISVFKSLANSSVPSNNDSHKGSRPSEDSGDKPPAWKAENCSNQRSSLQ